MKKDHKQELKIGRRYDSLMNHLSHLTAMKSPGGTRALDHPREKVRERTTYFPVALCRRSGHARL